MAEEGEEEGEGAASRRHAQGGPSDDLLHERIGLVLLAAFAFYVVVWNGVFSNLPRATRWPSR